MLNLLLVSIFGRIESDNNDRINSLHDHITGYVKIVTMDFSHRAKNYHSKQTSRNVDFLHVSPYSSNLSMARIISHWTFAFRLFRYLIKNGNKYNVIYCLIPSPSSALACTIYKWIYPHKLLILDIIDIWPEALIPISRKYKGIYPLLIPWKWMSIVAYKNADAIFAATKKYQATASHYNPKVFSSYYPLGIDSEKVNSIRSQSKLEIKKPSSELWVCYAGNLGASYDFDAMIKAVLFAKSLNNNFKIKFIFIGGGDKEHELKNMLTKLEIDFIITGNMAYKDYLHYLSCCDIGFNIYVANTRVIQSYKFNDYIASDIYIMNNLKGETAKLIEKYNVGKNLSGSNNQLGEVLAEVIANWDSIRLTISQNCKFLINKELDKTKIYKQLESDLLSLTSET